MPILYGVIPRTFCGERVGKLMQGARRSDGEQTTDDTLMINGRLLQVAVFLIRL